MVAIGTSQPGQSQARTRPPGLVPWRPGISGNPSGSSKMQRELVAFCRAKSIEGYEQVIDIASDPENDPRVRVVAWGMVFDRAWGKPKEQKDDDKDRPAPDFSRLSAKQLAQLKAITAILKGGTEGETPDPAPIQAEPDGIECPE